MTNSQTGYSMTDDPAPTVIKRPVRKQRFPVVTICGSMRYFKAMLAIADTETQKGHIVLMPFVKHILPGEQAGNPVKEMLDEMHLRKIDMSDGIVVVGNYIGESTRKEWMYAADHGKGIVHYTTVDHLL